MPKIQLKKCLFQKTSVPKYGTIEVIEEAIENQL
jgi:hypothetical protein